MKQLQPGILVLLSIVALSPTARAQSIIEGPGILEINSNEVRMRFEVDRPHQAQVRYWGASEAEEMHSMNLPAARIHEFPLPKKPFKYRIYLMNDADSVLYRSALYNTDVVAYVSVPKLSVESIEVVEGTKARIAVQSSNVPSVTYSWLDENVIQSQTRGLSGGREEHVIELPAPAAGQSARSVELNITPAGLPGTSHNVSTTPEVITAPPPRVGNVFATPTAHGAKIVMNVVSDVQTPIYRVTITNAENGFRLTRSGPCSSSNRCEVEVSGLSPGKTYTYTAEAANIDTGGYGSMNPSTERFTTPDLPKIVSGPSIAFTPNGLRIIFETSAPTSSIISFKTESDTNIVVSRISGSTSHSYDVPSNLVVRSIRDGHIQSDFVLEIKDAATSTPIYSSNLAVGSDFSQMSTFSDRDKRKKRRAEFQETLQEYGPTVVKLIGTAIGVAAAGAN